MKSSNYFYFILTILVFASSCKEDKKRLEQEPLALSEHFEMGAKAKKVLFIVWLLVTYLML